MMVEEDAGSYDETQRLQGYFNTGKNGWKGKKGKAKETIVLEWRKRQELDDK